FTVHYHFTSYPSAGHLLDLHSFPTRRSSDLCCSRPRLFHVPGLLRRPAHAPGALGHPYRLLHRRLRPFRLGAAGALCARTHSHRSEEHTSELQSRENLVCRLLLVKKKKGIAK